MTFSVKQLLREWDAQQTAYIAHREMRFDIALEALAMTFGDDFHVLDIGCGPGSFSRRVLARFPAARVTAVDLDPLMLALAQTSLQEFATRVTFIRADISAPDAFFALDGAPQAAVSSTAIHWLLPEQQAELYRRIHRLLDDGGLFINADHQRFDDRQPRRKALAAQHDERTQAAAWARGVPDWDRWFETVRQQREWRALCEERDAIFAAKPAPLPTGIGFQLAMLRQAGFAESGTLWQHLDDYVIAGWKQDA